MNRWGNSWSGSGRPYSKWNLTAWMSSCKFLKGVSAPGTPFFESLTKKPPTTMDDLFKGANKYSMLEDDVHAPTHLVLITSRLSRNDLVGNSKTTSQRRQTDKGQDRQRQSNQANPIPLSISYDKLIPMSQDLFDFRWRELIETNPAKRDWNRKCAYHKDHGHTTE